jgi:hypothetical protein
MPVLPLTQGAYTARSVIAEAQKCLNLYPEGNPQDAEVPVTHYPTPGLTLQVPAPIVAPVRQMYMSTTKQLYAVIGPNVYYINNAFGATYLGALSTSVGMVSMDDDGNNLIIVDGSSIGFVVLMSNNTMTQIVDPNYLGANFVHYMDTYFIFSQLNGPMFTTQSNVLTFNPLSVAYKSGYSDPLQAIATVHREIWVFGTETTEVWGANGNTAQFPYQPISGVFIQHGLISPASLAQWGLNLFWLSQDNKGQALVMLGTAYKANIISTPAIAQEFSSYSVITDAIGFCYQQGSHIFYQLTFPTMNKTWVYDLSSGFWHQRCSLDANGNQNRHVANCSEFAYQYNLVGDYQSGKIYAYDLNNYTDNGAPIIRVRSFPHITAGGKRAAHMRFIADVEVGTIDPGVVGNPQTYTPQLSLRWSDTRGRTWSNPVLMPMGQQGQFDYVPTWWRLGYARDRVYELSWSEPCAAALNGAYLEVQEMET